MATRILIGCGYLGSRVAKLWRAAGDDVIATSRSGELPLEMLDAGVFPARAEVTEPETLKWLPVAPALTGNSLDALVYSVGYDRSAEADIHNVYADGLANVLAAMPSSVKRVIYISTTGVYGAAGGEWVDEQTPSDPQRDGGKASLAAEEVLRNHPIGKSSLILRLAGIYGPDRIPYIDKLRAGEPLAVPSEGWLNLIHVDDAAAIVVAADRWANESEITHGPAVFCVSDGRPVVRGEYYREVAQLIGTAEPGFAKPDADSPAAARARADKRISNRKLVDTIQPSFLYPDYRAGLAAILAGSER
jgi:nucleoside-diphosphate-sugar epimerase